MRAARLLYSPFRPDAGKRICIGQTILLILALIFPVWQAIYEEGLEYLLMTIPILLILEFIITPMGYLTIRYLMESKQKHPTPPQNSEDPPQELPSDNVPSDLLNPENPANPASPLSPANPANPASPFNIF